MRYQPRHSRRRKMGVASLVAAGVLGVGGAALFAAPVSADPTELTAGAVAFDGNCGLLGIAAQSVPNRQSMQVYTSGQVTFVNDLPCNAHLYINGQRSSAVQRGGSVPVAASQSFAANSSTEVKMVPDGVGLLTSVKAVTITATTPPADNGSGNSGSGNTGSGNTGSGNGQESGSSDNSSDGGHSSSHDGQQSTDKDKAPGRQPNGGASPTHPKVHDPVARGAVPSSAAGAGEGSGTSGGSGEASGASQSQHDNAAAPRPVSSVTPARATSVLALIAAVCLAGVGVAAIRTTFTQRHGGSASA
ncbi:MAG: hypothetical protein WCA46_11485 [Actinocatenispora sp.]